jgi:uncharacterized protein (TIGR03435 family)
MSSAATFDLAATAGKAVSQDEIKRMIGPLLTERFHLQFHRETRELPVYALVQGKGGPKFKQPGDSGPPSIRLKGQGVISFQNWTMENLADWLTRMPGMVPVVDRTGLAGSFSFEGNLLGVDSSAGIDETKKAMMEGGALGTLRSTLPDQLGLKLESQKAQLEMIVIDNADRVPTGN